MLGMISVQDALKTILRFTSLLPPEKIELTSLLGRVLAEDIRSDVNIPPLDNSAMDGYAVKASSTSGATLSRPKILDVIDDVKAGYISPNAVGRGQAARIMTGAAVPRGADTVVMVERTKKRGRDKVEVFKGAEEDENIRRAGEDIKKGEKIFKKGTLLNPARIGMLASLGKSRVLVTKRPRIGILATGDEVVDVGRKMAAGKIRSSITYALYGQIVDCGGVPKNLGIAKDDPAELRRKIKKGLDCDILLTSGGVSVGDYDFVKDVLADLGTSIKFWQVRMRPGKPLVFGTLGKTKIFGLPGNPVSSMIGFEIFVRPAVMKMSGQSIDPRNMVEAVLENDITKRRGFRYFVRAKTHADGGRFYTRITGPQGSGILKSMSLANSLIILLEEREKVKRGTRVPVLFLE